MSHFLGMKLVTYSSRGLFRPQTILKDRALRKSTNIYCGTFCEKNEPLVTIFKNSITTDALQGPKYTAKSRLSFYFTFFFKELLRGLFRT